MDGIDPDVERLRQQFAGSYVAWLDDEVYLSTPTYDELCDRLDPMPIDEGRLIVEYVAPLDVIHIWSPRVSWPRLAIGADRRG